MVMLCITIPETCGECPLCRYTMQEYRSICPLTGTKKGEGKRGAACPLIPVIETKRRQKKKKGGSWDTPAYHVQAQEGEKR